MVNFGVVGVNFFFTTGDLLVVRLVIGVVFFVVMVVIMIFLLVVLGCTTGEVVGVVERVVVERCLGVDVVEEVVDSVISILLVEGRVLDDVGSKLVAVGLEFPDDGCNGKYPIGNWPLKFVAKSNGNI